MRRDGLASSAKAFGFESEVLTAEALEEPADRPADDAALVDRQVDVRSAVGGRGKGVVTVIVVLVLVASTDRMLRELKSRGWKDLQRLNYTLFALVVVHATSTGSASE